MFRLQFKILRRTRLLSPGVFQKYKSIYSHRKHISSHLKLPLLRKLSVLLNIFNKQIKRKSTLENNNDNLEINWKSNKIANAILKKKSLYSGKDLKKCSCDNILSKNAFLIKIELSKALFSKFKSYDTVYAKYYKLQQILARVTRYNFKMRHCANKNKDDDKLFCSKGKFKKKPVNKSKTNTKKMFICKIDDKICNLKSKSHCLMKNTNPEKKSTKLSNHNSLHMKKNNIPYNLDRRNRKKLINIVIEISGTDIDYSNNFGTTSKKAISILNKVSPGDVPSENVYEKDMKFTSKKHENILPLAPKQEIEKMSTLLNPTEKTIGENKKYFEAELINFKKIINYKKLFEMKTFEHVNVQAKVDKIIKSAPLKHNIGLAALDTKNEISEKFLKTTQEVHNKDRKLVPINLKIDSGNNNENHEKILNQKNKSIYKIRHDKNEDNTKSDSKINCISFKSELNKTDLTKTPYNLNESYNQNPITKNESKPNKNKVISKLYNIIENDFQTENENTNCNNNIHSIIEKPVTNENSSLLSLELKTGKQNKPESLQQKTNDILYCDLKTNENKYQSKPGSAKIINQQNTFQSKAFEKNIPSNDFNSTHNYQNFTLNKLEFVPSTFNNALFIINKNNIQKNETEIKKSSNFPSNFATETKNQNFNKFDKIINKGKDYINACNAIYNIINTKIYEINNESVSIAKPVEIPVQKKCITDITKSSDSIKIDNNQKYITEQQSKMNKIENPISVDPQKQDVEKKDIAIKIIQSESNKLNIMLSTDIKKENNNINKLNIKEIINKFANIQNKTSDKRDSDSMLNISLNLKQNKHQITNVSNTEYETGNVQNNKTNITKNKSNHKITEVENKTVNHFIKNTLIKEIKPNHRVFKVKPYIKLQNYTAKEISSELKDVTQKQDNNKIQPENNPKIAKTDVKSSITNNATANPNDGIRQAKISQDYKTRITTDMKIYNEKQLINTKAEDQSELKSEKCEKVAVTNKLSSSEKSVMDFKNKNPHKITQNFINNYTLEHKCEKGNVNQNITELQRLTESTDGIFHSKQDNTYLGIFASPLCSQNPSNYENNYNNNSIINKKYLTKVETSKKGLNTFDQIEINKRELLSVLIKFYIFLFKEVNKAIEINSKNIDVTVDLYSQLKKLMIMLTKKINKNNDANFTSEKEKEYETFKTNLLNALIKFKSTKAGINHKQETKNKMSSIVNKKSDIGATHLKTQICKSSLPKNKNIDSSSKIKKKKKQSVKIRYGLVKKFGKIIESKYNTKMGQHSLKSNENNCDILKISKVTESKCKPSTSNHMKMGNYSMTVFQSNQNINYTRTTNIDKQNYNNKYKFHTSPILMQSSSKNKDKIKSEDKRINRNNKTFHDKPLVNQIKKRIKIFTSIVNKAPGIYKIPKKENKNQNLNKSDKNYISFLKSKNQTDISKRYNLNNSPEPTENKKLNDNNIHTPYLKKELKNVFLSAIETKFLSKNELIKIKRNKIKDKYQHCNIIQKTTPRVLQTKPEVNIGVKKLENTSSSNQSINVADNQSLNKSMHDNSKYNSSPENDSKVLNKINNVEKKMNSNISSDENKIEISKAKRDTTNISSLDTKIQNDQVFNNNISGPTIQNYENQFKNKLAADKSKQNNTYKISPKSKVKVDNQVNNNNNISIKYKYVFYNVPYRTKNRDKMDKAKLFLDDEKKSSPQPKINNIKVTNNIDTTDSNSQDRKGKIKMKTEKLASNSKDNFKMGTKNLERANKNESFLETDTQPNKINKYEKFNSMYYRNDIQAQTKNETKKSKHDSKDKQQNSKVKSFSGTQTIYKTRKIEKQKILNSNESHKSTDIKDKTEMNQVKSIEDNKNLPSPETKLKNEYEFSNINNGSNFNEFYKTTENQKMNQLDAEKSEIDTNNKSFSNNMNPNYNEVKNTPQNYSYPIQSYQITENYTNNKLERMQSIQENADIHSSATNIKTNYQQHLAANEYSYPNTPNFLETNKNMYQDCLETNKSEQKQNSSFDKTAQTANQNNIEEAESMTQTSNNTKYNNNEQCSNFNYPFKISEPSNILNNSETKTTYNPTEYQKETYYVNIIEKQPNNCIFKYFNENDNYSQLDEYDRTSSYYLTPNADDIGFNTLNQNNITKDTNRFNTNETNLSTTENRKNMNENHYNSFHHVQDDKNNSTTYNNPDIYSFSTYKNNNANENDPAPNSSVPFNLGNNQITKISETNDNLDARPLYHINNEIYNTKPNILKLEVHQFQKRYLNQATETQTVDPIANTIIKVDDNETNNATKEEYNNFKQMKNNSYVDRDKEIDESTRQFDYGTDSAQYQKPLEKHHSYAENKTNANENDPAQNSSVPFNLSNNQITKISITNNNLDYRPSYHINNKIYNTKPNILKLEVHQLQKGYLNQATETQTVDPIDNTITKVDDNETNNATKEEYNNFKQINNNSYVDRDEEIDERTRQFDCGTESAQYQKPLKKYHSHAEYKTNENENQDENTMAVFQSANTPFVNCSKIVNQNSNFKRQPNHITPVNYSKPVPYLNKYNVNPSTENENLTLNFETEAYNLPIKNEEKSYKCSKYENIENEYQSGVRMPAYNSYFKNTFHSGPLPYMYTKRSILMQNSKSENSQNMNQNFQMDNRFVQCQQNQNLSYRNQSENFMKGVNQNVESNALVNYTAQSTEDEARNQTIEIGYENSGKNEYDTSNRTRLQTFEPSQKVTRGFKQNTNLMKNLMSYMSEDRSMENTGSIEFNKNIFPSASYPAGEYKNILHLYRSQNKKTIVNRRKPSSDSTNTHWGSRDYYNFQAKPLCAPFNKFSNNSKNNFSSNSDQNLKSTGIKNKKSSASQTSSSKNETNSLNKLLFNDQKYFASNKSNNCNLLNKIFSSYVEICSENEKSSSVSKDQTNEQNDASNDFLGKLIISILPNEKINVCSLKANKNKNNVIPEKSIFGCNKYLQEKYTVLNSSSQEQIKNAHKKPILTSKEIVKSSLQEQLKPAPKDAIFTSKEIQLNQYLLKYKCTTNFSNNMNSKIEETGTKDMVNPSKKYIADFSNVSAKHENKTINSYTRKTDTAPKQDSSEKIPIGKIYSENIVCTSTRTNELNNTLLHHESQNKYAPIFSQHLENYTGFNNINHSLTQNSEHEVKIKCSPKNTTQNVNKLQNSKNPYEFNAAFENAYTKPTKAPPNNIQEMKSEIENKEINIIIPLEQNNLLVVKCSMDSLTDDKQKNITMIPKTHNINSIVLTKSAQVSNCIMNTDKESLLENHDKNPIRNNDKNISLPSTNSHKSDSRQDPKNICENISKQIFLEKEPNYMSSQNRQFLKKKFNPINEDFFEILEKKSELDINIPNSNNNIKQDANFNSIAIPQNANENHPLQINKKDNYIIAIPKSFDKAKEELQPANNCNLNITKAVGMASQQINEFLEEKERYSLESKENVKSIVDKLLEKFRIVLIETVNAQNSLDASKKKENLNDSLDKNSSAIANDEKMYTTGKSLEKNEIRKNGTLSNEPNLICTSILQKTNTNTLMKELVSEETFSESDKVIAKIKSSKQNKDAIIKLFDKTIETIENINVNDLIDVRIVNLLQENNESNTNIKNESIKYSVSRSKKQTDININSVKNLSNECVEQKTDNNNNPIVTKIQLVLENTQENHKNLSTTNSKSTEKSKDKSVKGKSTNSFAPSVVTKSLEILDSLTCNKQDNKLDSSVLNKNPFEVEDIVTQDKTTPKQIQIQDNPVFQAAMQKFENKIIETIMKSSSTKNNKPIITPLLTSDSKPTSKVENYEKPKKITVNTSLINDNSTLKNVNNVFDKSKLITHGSNNNNNSTLK